MIRTMIVVLAIASASCAATTTTTSPTPTAADADTLQKEFSSNVVPGGGASRTFEVTTAGPISVLLKSTTPGGVQVGMGLGIPRSNGSCALSAAIETTAGTAAQITIAADTGSYCARVYDLGTLSAPLTFTISISRP